MPVSEKMATAAFESAKCDHMLRNATDVAQSAVNAAWNPFDPEDENTWPLRDIEWLVIYGFGDNDRYAGTDTFEIFNHVDKLAKPEWGGFAGSVLYWADPADLMPEIE